MRTLTIGLLLWPTVLAAVPAWAAEQMKPGLWEMTMKSDAVASMPQMTTEQVEQMRKMGVTMPQTTPDGAMVTKVCITKQTAERDQPPGMSQNESGCQSKNYRRSGNSYSVDIVCTGPTMKGEGKARGTFAGDRFTSIYDFKGTMNGQPVTQHHENSGRWLAADCGTVRPMAEPPKK